jgi:hypothetical protein
MGLLGFEQSDFRTENSSTRSNWPADLHCLVRAAMDMNSVMNCSEILSAVDAEIARLQSAGALLAGSKASGGGIHEGQECDSSGAAVRRTATELCWAALLGTPQSGRRRQTVGADEPVAITCPYGGPNQTGTVFAAQHQSFRAVLHLLTNH